MMRRPMYFAALGCAAAIMISYYAGIAIAAAAIGVFSLCYLLHAKASDPRLKRISAVVLAAYCLGAASFWHEDRLLQKQAHQLEGNRLYGEVKDCGKRVNQQGEPYLRLVIQSDQGKVLAKYYESCQNAEDVIPGSLVSITGEMQVPEGRRNPGCFDYALYLRSLGIARTVTCSNVDVHGQRKYTQNPAAFAAGRVYCFKEQFLEKLAGVADARTASVIRAVIFGDKGDLDGDVLEAFQKNGTAHILAVSGLHIGIIYGFILKLWRWRRRWVFFAFNMSFFLLYAMASGFSPSVTRAVVMVLLHIIAGMTGKRYDLVNAAFFVFLAVIMRNPFMLFNTGFQMSLLAVLTIALFLPYFSRLYSGIFLASLAVQAGLGPFLIYQFNYLSVLSVIVNVPVVALAGLIVPSALLAMAVSQTPLIDPAASLIKPLCEVLVRLNEVTQVDGITSFQVASPPLWIMAAYYLCLLTFATEEGRLHLIRAVKKGRYILKMLLLITVLSICFHAVASNGFEKCDITFVDVGQGDCVCVKTEGGLWEEERCFLFDGGGSADYNIGKSTLRSYLLKNGVSHVDGAFVTHLHMDHYKGICELAKEGMIDTLFVYEANQLKQKQLMEETGLDAKRFVYLGKGDYISLRKNNSVYLEVLHPARKSDAQYQKLIADETDENLLSLIFKISFSGSKSNTALLITGDMGEEGEMEMIREYGRHVSGTSSSELCSSILKVGHHGSKTSSTDPFLDAVQPKFAVIQVGKHNMYGHPTPEALQRLADAGAAIYRNDLMGAVGFEIKKGEVVDIKTMINDE